MILEGYDISFHRWEYQRYEDFLEESLEIADIDIEGDLWSPLYGSEPSQLKVSFVDGVQRIHQFVYLSSNKDRGEGIFVSLGAGAMLLIKEGNSFRSKYVTSEKERLFITNANIKGSIEVEWAGYKMSFSIVNSSKEPMNHVLNELKRLEYIVVKKVYKDFSPDFIIWDGTLKYNLREGSLPVVGAVKRHMKYFIPQERADILRDMEVGQRTPLILLKSLDTERAFDRYTWYVKVDEGGIASTVRFEVPADIDKEKVIDIANTTAWLYPMITSMEFTDKRSPHNVAPLRYIEKTLSRELGNPFLLKRAIEVELSKFKG